MGIDKKEKSKKKRKKKRPRAEQGRLVEDKENRIPMKRQSSESNQVKENRIQEGANIKIRGWIERGTKEEWLSFKNN